MASHGFIFEASSLVSIFSLGFCIHSKVSHFMLPTDVSGSHVLSRFYFCSLRVCVVFDHFGYPAPPIGDWRHMKWYNLRSVQQTLEEMQQRITSGLTPLPPLQIASALGLPAGLAATPGPSASGSHVRPEVAKKAPRSKAGKAQLAATLQPRGHGSGSKGIRLEDSPVPGGAKRKKRSNEPDSSNNRRPQYEDTFEDSDDSTESFDGPFPGPSSSAVASSTTGTTSQTSK